MADGHPIWAILEYQSRTLAWLARRTGYSEQTVRSISCGRRGASRDFRARAAAALDLPESVLFHDGSSASPSRRSPKAGSDNRAGTADEPEVYAPQEVLSV